MKKRLKQVLGIILLLTVVLTLSACSQHADEINARLI